MIKYRQNYHLMPLIGWLNDPNGLCYYNQQWHIFFQEDAHNIPRKKVGWGHFTTKDFHTYVRQVDAIYPDSQHDCDGAYSGSAIEKDGVLHLFYTGNVKLDGNYDYINVGREHNLMHVSSQDGVHFVNKEVLLFNKDYPNDLSCHVRDPKIYKEDGKYWIVLGARTKDSHGCILLYESVDLEHWNYVKRYVPEVDDAYMLECPDYIELDGHPLLLCSPQGLKQDGYKYENVYDSGYYELDNTTLKNYHSLEHGFDFYAPQTMKKDGRTILIGWMGMPDATYTCPTEQEHWMHCLTLPRQLIYDNGIKQYPIQEILDLKKNIQKHSESFEQTKCSGITFKSDTEFDLKMNSIQLSYHNHLLTLSMGDCGYGRTERHINDIDVKNGLIFIDQSSIEIFMNDGEYVMTTRYFDSNETVKISNTGLKEIEGFEMTPFNICEGE